MAAKELLALERDAQFTRIQRALALKMLKDTKSKTATATCHSPDSFHPRRSSEYPFEQDVTFVAINIQIHKNKKGAMDGVAVARARLRTERLDRLPPGLNGEHFIQEITSMHRRIMNGPGLSDENIAWVRKCLAQSFELPRVTPNLEVDCELPPQNHIIFVCHDRSKVLGELAEFGFDPRRR